MEPNGEVSALDLLKQTSTKVGEVSALDLLNNSQKKSDVGNDATITTDASVVPVSQPVSSSNGNGTNLSFLDEANLTRANQNQDEQFQISGHTDVHKPIVQPVTKIKPHEFTATTTDGKVIELDNLKKQATQKAVEVSDNVEYPDIKQLGELYTQKREAEKSRVEQFGSDAYRADGSVKDNGFLGQVKMKDGSGRVASEISIGVEFDGKETEIPSIVPTLNKQEIDYLLKGNKPTDAIVEKATEYAKGRISKGQSPFYSSTEDIDKQINDLRNSKVSDDWRINGVIPISETETLPIPNIKKSTYKTNGELFDATVKAQQEHKETYDKAFNLQQQLAPEIAKQKEVNKYVEDGTDANGNKYMRLNPMQSFVEGFDKSVDNISTGLMKMNPLFSKQELADRLKRNHVEQMLFPKQAEGIPAKATEMLGGVAPLIASTAVAPEGVGALALNALTFGVGDLGSGLQEGYSEAKLKGLDDATALAFADKIGAEKGVTGALLGGTMPLQGVLGRRLFLNSAGAGAFKTMLAEQGAMVPSFMTKTFVDNIGAKEIGSDRNVNQGVLESGISAFILAGMTHAIATVPDLPAKTSELFKNTIAKNFETLGPVITQAGEKGMLPAGTVKDIIERADAFKVMGHDLPPHIEKRMLPIQIEINRLEKANKDNEDKNGWKVAENKAKIEELNNRQKEEIGSPLDYKEQKHYEDLVAKRDEPATEGKPKEGLTDLEKADLKHYQNRIDNAEKIETDKDVNIEKFQKSNKLATEPEVVLSDDANKIQKQIEETGNAPSQDIKTLSDELYRASRALAKTRDNANRRFSKAQIDAKVSELEKKVEILESARSKQLETDAPETIDFGTKPEPTTATDAEQGKAKEGETTTISPAESETPAEQTTEPKEEPVASAEMPVENINSPNTEANEKAETKTDEAKVLTEPETVPVEKQVTNVSEYKTKTEDVIMPDGEPGKKVTIVKPNGEEVDLGNMYPEDVESEVAKKVRGYKLQGTKPVESHHVNESAKGEETNIGKRAEFLHAGQDVSGEIKSIDADGNYKITDEHGTNYTVKPENANIEVTGIARVKEGWNDIKDAFNNPSGALALNPKMIEGFAKMGHGLIEAGHATAKDVIAKIKDWVKANGGWTTKLTEKDFDESAKDIEKRVEDHVKNKSWAELKDVWMGNVDVAKQRAISEAANFQKEIQATVAKIKGEGTFKWNKRWQDVDKAIHIYLDLKRNPAHLAEHYDSLTPEQKKIVDLSQNLTPEQKDIADRISKEYEKVGQQSKDAGIIKDALDNYVARAWDFKGTSLETARKFGTSTKHSLQRSLDTILEGQAKGYNLKVGGATNNLSVLKQEIAQVIENKALIDRGSKTVVNDEGDKLFTTKKQDGYSKINHPLFKKWGFAGKIDADQNATQVMGKRKGIVVTEDGTVMEKQDVYAPDAVAKNLNNILGQSALKGYPAADAIRKFNNAVKQTILTTSLFHHLAFLRNKFLTGTFNKIGDLSPAQTYQQGLDAIRQMTPEVEMLVRNGMTLGKIQDWDESVNQEKGFVGKKLDSWGVAPGIRDRVTDLIGRQKKFLFDEFGAGLKAFDGMNMLKRELAKNPTADPNEIAKNVGAAMNNNYGGLHLQRIGRNPTTQDLMHLLLLAPDWTESNLRMAASAFKTGHDGEFSRKMWGKVLLRGASAIAISNLAMSLLPDPNDKEKDPIKAMEQRYKRAWDEGNLNWMKVNLSPLAHEFGAPEGKDYYFSLTGHYGDPLRLVSSMLNPKGGSGLKFFVNKGSVISKIAGQALTSQDWKGEKYTSIDELLGLDDKGLYKNKVKKVINGRREVVHHKGEEKGGQLKGHLTKQAYGVEDKAAPVNLPEIPSFVLDQVRGMMPTQIQNVWTWGTGESDGFSTVANSIGLGVNKVSIPKGKK